MPPPPDLISRADAYCRSRMMVRDRLLGEGKDGAVWYTSHPRVPRNTRAIKIHLAAPSYRSEQAAYNRLAEVQLSKVLGFRIPTILGFDDELLALEMTVEIPPFIVDFASARIDMPDDLIEDDGNRLEDTVRERFGDRADQVMAIHFQLVDAAGISLSDLHPENIKFGV